MCPVASPAIDGGGRAKFDVTKMRLAAVAMGPRPQDEPLGPALGGFEARVVAGCG